MSFDQAHLRKKLNAAQVILANDPRFDAISGMLYIGADHIVADGWEGISTAGTDGLNTYWSDKFLDACSVPALCAAMLHERIHNMLRHPGEHSRFYQAGGLIGPIPAKDASEDAKRDWQTKQRKLNKACDFVVNGYIASVDPTQQTCKWTAIPQPAIWLLDDKYKGWSVEMVYRDLKDDDGEGEGGMDSHGQWVKWEDLDPQQQQQIKDKIDTALRMGKQRQQMREAGQGTNDIDRLVDGLIEDKKDWRTELAEFATAHAKGADFSTYSRPRRRMLAEGLYLPTTYGQAIEEACVFIDTSGSIGEHDLQVALGSVRSILQAFQVEKLHMIYWDDGVASHETYSMVDDQVVKQTSPKGGGGTSFAPVLDYMTKHKLKPSFGVCFTDGYIGDWGREPSWPMLWVVSTDQQAPWGRQVKYTEQ